MIKVVENGERICTVTLDGSESSIVFQSSYRYFAVRNESDADVYVSLNRNIVEGADGVMTIGSKESAVFPCMKPNVNMFFIKGKGKIQVIASSTPDNPFNFAPAFDGGVMASGNPVQIDGLQGGVPFSEMVVSGKNLIPFPYYDGNSKTHNGITFTVNADGTITANGTATASAIFYISTNYTIKKGIYTLSGCPKSDSNTNYILQFATGDWSFKVSDFGNGATTQIDNDINLQIFRIAISNGVVCDNLVFRPQLEIGSTPTEHEPPIIGRELTVWVCGKNLFDYRISAIPTGITVTTLDDGSLKVSGKMERESAWGINLIAKSPLPKGEAYTLSINPDVIGILPISVYYIGSAKEKQTFIWNRDDYFTVSLNIQPNVDYDFIFRPQLELGSTATPYEPYSGSTTTITPDTNAYVIPNDIRQQDGLNVVTASAGTLEVVSVRKNAALKKLWDEIDEIKTAIIVSNGESE